MYQGKVYHQQGVIFLSFLWSGVDLETVGLHRGFGFPHSRETTTHLNHLPINLPSDELLAQGGDSRSVIAPDSTNKYRCSTFPRNQIIPFGSCTASNISDRGYAAAKMMLNRLRGPSQFDPKKEQ